MGSTSIGALLETWGLPLIESRQDVQDKVGVQPDPLYLWPTLVMDAPPLTGALAPWTAEASGRIPPQFPISRFSTILWFVDDAVENIRRTAQALSVDLGPATIRQRHNTLVCEWRQGLAEVSLMAWPPAWQTHGLANDAHAREPRLKTACHISVATGFCLPLTEADRMLLKTYHPIMTSPSRNPAGGSAPSEREMERVRAMPPGELPQGFGSTADDQALVVVSHQLFIARRADMVGFVVERLSPAKGSGGATLRLLCRTSAPEADWQSILLTHADKPDDLNALAADLAARFGCPLDIQPCHPDV